MKLPETPVQRAECQKRVIAFLDDIWLRMQQKRPVQADPFYSRNDVLTPEVVSKLITNIEALFVNELTRFKGYHEGRNEIQPGQTLVAPGFDRLTAGEKLAVVQGIDRIFCEYRKEDDG